MRKKPGPLNERNLLLQEFKESTHNLEMSQTKENTAHPATRSHETGEKEGPGKNL